MYSVEYTATSKKDLHALSEKLAQRIIKKINFFASLDDLDPFCKKLQGFVEPTYRFRIGAYRVLFDISSSGKIHILNILRIKHRKDIYEL